MQRCNLSGAEDLTGGWRGTSFLRSQPAPQRVVLLENKSDKPRESEGSALSPLKAARCLLHQVGVGASDSGVGFHRFNCRLHPVLLSGSVRHIHNRVFLQIIP